MTGEIVSDGDTPKHGPEGVQVEVPPEATVIRFKPVQPESVPKRAQKEYRRVHRYGLSVFADVLRDGENEYDLHLRLLKASERAYILPDNNPKYYVCTHAADLLSRGFSFWKDGDDDEVEEHYTVNLGDFPTLVTVTTFLAPFREEARKK